MRTLAAILLWCAAAPVVTSESARAQLPAGGDVAVRCARLHVGDGTVVTGAWLIVRDGKIEAVRAGGDAPAGLPVVDVGDRVVVPGLVAADTDLSNARDQDYAVTPDFVAADGFDFVRSYSHALSGGVTAVYLSPGRRRLISGQGSVVKLHGDDLVHRALAERACLRVTLGEESTDAPAVFEPTIHPTAEDPLVPARKQYPSARISQLATLRRLFRQASEDPDGGLVGAGSAENRYDARPLHAVATGSLPLRIAAREAADIRRAVSFAERIGARLVLEDPIEIGRVADVAARAAAAAVFRLPIRLGDDNPGGETDSDAPAPGPENAADAALAGMTVAIAPATDEDLADLLMVAGLAVRFGLPADRALRAVTLDAATVLGVDDRVGSLAAGKDADFLVLSGEPFAVGTMVESTWVDGVPAYERETVSTMLAVRTGKIVTAAGDTFHDGVILVADGKIKGVGEGLAAPYGSRVVDVPGGVMVPGFIDAHSTLGLGGPGGVPNGEPDQRIADVIRADDPAFRTALEGGITTALVAGGDRGTVSGRVTAIKLGAADRESAVLRAIAGVRMVHDEVGPDAIKPVRDAFDRAEKYVEAWRKYEKALADFEAGKGEKPIEEPAPAPAEGAPDPVSGVWEVRPTNSRFPLEMTLDLSLQGTNVTGTIAVRIGGREIRPPTDLESGKFENGTLTLTATVMNGTNTLTAQIADDRLTGTMDAGPQTLELEGERTEKRQGGAAPTNGATSDGRPRKPAVDEKLEPLRAVIEGRARAVVRADKAPAIRDVIAFFEEKKLPFVLHGAEDAVDDAALLGEHAPPVILGPDLVGRDGGEVVNAAARLAEHDVVLAFATGDHVGSRYLPVHAALAVRYGLDPTAALAAMTSGAAAAFGIDDRVGSLERGKDADFVVFDGDPFEPTSRVVLVVCNGRVVVDRRGGR